MEGLKIGGVVIMATSDDFVDVRIPIKGTPINVTSGGNDLLSYAKVPFGASTVQITSWTDGPVERVAMAKAAKKADKRKTAEPAATKTVLLKRPVA